MLLKEPTNGASDGRLSITSVKKYYHYLPLPLVRKSTCHPPKRRDNKELQNSTYLNKTIKWPICVNMNYISSQITICYEVLRGSRWSNYWGKLFLTTKVVYQWFLTTVKPHTHWKFTSAENSKYHISLRVCVFFYEMKYSNLLVFRKLAKT